MIKLDEQSILHLEAHFPELAASATTQAYWQTLASGGTVLEVENGVVVEVYPDGRREFVKQVNKRIPVSLGEIRELK